MNVLAIDPGSLESGYVVWDGAGVLDHCICGNEGLLAGLSAGEFDYVDVCVIEDTECHPQKTQSGHPYIPKHVIASQRYVGRLHQAWVERGQGDPIFLSRREIRGHLRANKRSSTADSQIRARLIDRFGAPGTKAAPGTLYQIKSHEWAALAVAVTYCDQIPRAEF